MPSDGTLLQNAPHTTAMDAVGDPQAVASVAAADVREHRADLREKYTSPRDVTGFHVESTLCLAAIWGVLLGAMAGWWPTWLLALTPLLFIRFELATHEIMHCRAPWQVNVLVRRLWVAQSPYSLDYAGYREHHLAHHRYLGTPLDPEHYLIDVPWWRSLFNAMFAVEVVTWQGFRAARREPWFWPGLVLRIGVFAALAWWNPWVFLLYLAWLRVGMGIAEFFFHHCLHVESSRSFRAFRWVARRLPWVPGLALGWNKIPILLFHDEHHAYPLVAARHLESMRPV